MHKSFDIGGNPLFVGRLSVGGSDYSFVTNRLRRLNLLITSFMQIAFDDLKIMFEICCEDFALKFLAQNREIDREIN